MDRHWPGCCASKFFATNLIVHGADPKSVQELLGHKTLAMTMQIYAKVKGAPLRQAVAKLSYAQGVTPPEHVLPLPALPWRNNRCGSGKGEID